MKKIVCIIIGLTLLLSMNPSVSGYGINDQYTNLDGEQVSFDTYEGDYLFVDAMATDCPHCQNQHSVLEDLYNTRGNKIRMLSLAIWSRESVEEMKNFVNTYYTPWAAGHDPDQSFASTYGVSGTPTMILFGPTGGEITRWVGETSLSKLQSDIDYIISNQVSDSSDQLPTYIGNAGVSQPPSTIELLFRSPLFQGVSVMVLAVFIFFKSIGGPAEEVN